MRAISRAGKLRIGTLWQKSSYRFQMGNIELRLYFLEAIRHLTEVVNEGQAWSFSCGTPSTFFLCGKVTQPKSRNWLNQPVKGDRDA
jgi:hypothetical protein